ADVVTAGGGLLVDDDMVTPEWVRSTVLPLMADESRLTAMSRAAAGVGHRDADEALVDMVLTASTSR
ncbi:MAG: UDP-N-acetylglucosamine--N-acetylmuramyl-(pentapeptide) pyrophosphoryl-undecaprenol N-acetylglucosamine transferase, partial [Ornithinimicrobium sp.]